MYDEIEMFNSYTASIMAESPVKEMDVRTNKGNLCCYYLQYSMGLHGHTLKRVQFIFLCALNHLLEDIGTFCVERIVRSRRSFLVADAAAARLMKCV